MAGSDTGAIPGEPEFSRLVNLDHLSGQQAVFNLAAQASECQALAERFGIIAIDRLTATVTLKRLARGDISASIHIEASVVQECVVTMEPVGSEIDDRVELCFRPVEANAPDSALVEISADDDFEPFTGDVLDIGEVVASELSLSLDPFPRHPSASDASFGEPEEPAETKESPFRALEAHPRRR